MIIPIVLFLGVMNPAIGDSNADSNSRALYVIIHNEKDAQAYERDVNFITELKINLPGVEVCRMPPPHPEFFALPIGQQIKAINPAIDKNKTVAVVWVGDVPEDGVIMHLLTVSLERMYVRVIQVPMEADLETTLALSTKEMLGLAYLVEKLPEKSGKTLEVVIDDARDNIEKKPQPGLPKPSQAFFPTFSVDVSSHVGGSLAGGQAPSTLAGCGLGMKLILSNWMLLNLNFRYITGPLGTLKGYSIRSHDVSGSLGVQLGIGIKKIWLGCITGFILTYYETQASLNGSDVSGKNQRWITSFLIGPVFYWNLFRNLNIFSRFEIHPLWQKIRFTLDDDVFYSIGPVAWELVLGIAIDIRAR